MLLISINFTPKTSHSYLKNGTNSYVFQDLQFFVQTLRDFVGTQQSHYLGFTSLESNQHHQDDMAYTDPNLNRVSFHDWMSRDGSERING